MNDRAVKPRNRKILRVFLVKEPVRSVASMQRRQSTWRNREVCFNCKTQVTSPTTSRAALRFQVNRGVVLVVGRPLPISPVLGR